MAFTGKFLYMAQHLLLLWLGSFELRVGREGWWFEQLSSVIVMGLPIKTGC